MLWVMQLYLKLVEQREGFIVRSATEVLKCVRVTFSRKMELLQARRAAAAAEGIRR